MGSEEKEGGAVMTDVAKYHFRSVVSMVKTGRTVALAYVCILSFVVLTLFLAFNSSSPSSQIVVEHPRSQDVIPQIVVEHPRSQDVISQIMVEHPRSQDVIPQIVVEHPRSQDVISQIMVEHPRSQDVRPQVVVEHPRSQDVISQIVVEHPRSQDVISQIVVEHPRSQDVISQFEVEHSPKFMADQNKDVRSQSVVGHSIITSPAPDSVDPAKKGSKGINDSWIESLVKCDMFEGDWVRDDSYPLYEPGSCLLIDQQFSCLSNGRPDKDYLYYKWKPRGCSLPRLDANHLLEMLRGKRLVFVGDSLNKSMWESMVCILRSVLTDNTTVFKANKRRNVVMFKDYNLTVEFYIAHFLVREMEIKDKKTLRLDLMKETFDDLSNADILIFNTGHWWEPDKTNKGKDFYQEGSHVYHKLNVLKALRKGLTTWATWVDNNVDPSKSLVFFRAYSTQHFNGGRWNSGGSCDSETEPITNPTYLMPYPPNMKVLEEVMKRMKTHVSYLNITRMTDYRKDGHPSIYRWKNVSEMERKSSLKIQDCGHWCIPGVPDMWNELLYAKLLVREHLKKQMT